MDALSLGGDPAALRHEVNFAQGGTAMFRPLETGDVGRLEEYLSSLSSETRRFWNLESYDRSAAAELCDAIGRYDKLRFVAQETAAPFLLLASFEFSFGIPQGDMERFRSYSITLSETIDCRFAPCVRDALQGSGLANALMPLTIDIARRFGRSRIILWGGVDSENRRAIRFYEKHGFTALGRFWSSGGRESIDMILHLR
jgi:diamine N-acetyltransferase